MTVKVMDYSTKEQYFQDYKGVLSVNLSKIQKNAYIPTYCPFGHHWLAGTSSCPLLRLDLCFVDSILVFLVTLF